jgi:hypothetical protein
LPLLDMSHASRDREFSQAKEALPQHRGMKAGAKDVFYGV